MPTTDADRLRGVRLRAGLTELGLDEFAGNSVRTVGRLEHGGGATRASIRFTHSLYVMLHELLQQDYYRRTERGAPTAVEDER